MRTSALGRLLTVKLPLRRGEPNEYRLISTISIDGQPVAIPDLRLGVGQRLVLRATPMLHETIVEIFVEEDRQ